MNTPSQFNIEQTIKYLTGHPELLDKLSSSDLRLFKEALKLIKEQVIQQIIVDTVINNSNLPEQIASTKETLSSRLERLKQKQAFFLQQASISEAQPSSTILIEDQAKLLQSHIEVLESLSSSLDTPEEFIKIFLTSKIPDTPNSEEYNCLVKDCALSMVIPNNSPGNNSSGLTMREYKEYGPLFNTKPSTPHGFPIYILNPVSLARFYERIGNPKLINELDSYYTQASHIYSLESTFEYEKTKLEDAQNRRIAIEDPAIYQDIEKYLTSMYQAINNYSSAKQSLDESKASKPKTSNPFVKFFRKFVKNKKDQTSNLTTPVSNTNESDLQNTISHSLENLQELQSKHEERLKTDSNYALAYKTYLESAILPTYLSKIPKINLSSKKDKFYALNKVHFSEPTNIRTFATLLAIHEQEKSEFRNSILEGLNQSISNQQAIVTSLSEQLSQQESQTLPYSELTKAELYNKLSPEAQYLVDANINITELKKRYVDFTANSVHIYSPFAAALTVKALLRAFDIKTAKDAESLGLTFTQNEAIERQNTIESTISALPSHLEMLSGYGKELEER